MAESIIIGAGAAGVEAALTLRRLRPEHSVTIIDCEAETGYYRTLLPQFINRSLPENKLFFPNLADDPKIRIISGTSVESVDPQNRLLRLGDGSVAHYRRLLIASGGRPIVPGVCAPNLGKGIFPVRSLAVARAARDWIRGNREVVIVGGGLVGVKTAAHLAGYEYSVTLIEKEPHLLPQALSEPAARLIQKHLESQHIRLRLGASINDIRLQDGAIDEVRVDGSWMPAGTLFVAAGSVPEIAFLADSGLLRDGRLEVDSSLRTIDRCIFAAGDAVTIVDRDSHTPWTWPQAVAQGRLAAANMYADSPATLACLSRVNCMNLNGLSLAVLGIPVAGAEVMVYSQPEKHIYRELYHRDGKILGGALVGDLSNVGRLHARQNFGSTSDESIDDLLRPQINTFSKYSPSCRFQMKRVKLAASGESKT